MSLVEVSEGLINHVTSEARDNKEYGDELDTCYSFRDKIRFMVSRHFGTKKRDGAPQPRGTLLLLLAGTHLSVNMFDKFRLELERGRGSGL